MNLRSSLLVFVAAMLAGCSRSPSPRPELAPLEGGAAPSAPLASAASPDRASLPDPAFLELRSPGVGAAEPLPLVVAIHGMGDRPERWRGVLDELPGPVRLVLPRAPEPYGEGFTWFAYPPRSVEAMSGEIERAADRLASLLAKLRAERPTRGKPIVLGFSQGGFLSFALAVRHGDAIAVALPVAGGLPPPLWPSGAAAPGQAPIFAFHGTADAMVPIGPTRDAVARLTSLGFRVELKEHPGVAHTFDPAMRKAVASRIADTVASF